MRYLLWLLLLGCGGELVGQEAGPTYFQFTYQNDYFGATDYYFTQGIRLRYATPGIGRLPTARLLPIIPASTAPEHSITLHQDGYTPTSIRTDTILRGDRPYAGALYLGQEAISESSLREWRLRATLLLGVIGPAALAGEEQEFIHRQLDNVLPRGWQYQIGNDLLLNYQLELDRSLYRSSWLAISGGGHGWLGTYRTRLGGQGAIRLGWLDNERRQEATARKTRLFLFGAGRLSAIGYDASLQGGLFNRSSVYTIPPQSVNRFITTLEWGVQVRLGRLGLAFSRTFLSPEFRGGRPHDWGTVRLRWAAK